MESIKFDRIRAEVGKRLTKSRMEHTISVMAEAEALAERYGADKKKVQFAALCHDMARCLSSEEAKSCIEEFSIDSSYSDSIELSHGKIAAEWMKKDFGVKDIDILNAVSFHTTGRPGMSSLEKIIYIADAIEQGRSYPGVDEIRSLTYADLDKGCLKSMELTLEHLNSMGCRIHKDMLNAREFLLAEGRREDEQ